MPTLSLIFQGESLAFTLDKIDRDRLYGYVDQETTDDAGHPCAQALLTGDGHTLAGSGDTALAYLSPEGLWRDRSQLHALDARDGPLLVPVKSTFALPVNLDEAPVGPDAPPRPDPNKIATLDDYLSHTIRLVYRLTQEGGGSARPLLAELEEGTIFTFPFSYCGGDLASTGFVLLGSDGGIYLAVGEPCALDYATLDALATLVEGENSAADEEEELDFSVL
jgi:hypothetical protein